MSRIPTSDQVLMFVSRAGVPIAVLIIMACALLLQGCVSAPPEPCISLECHKKACVREQTRACQKVVWDKYADAWAAGVVDLSSMQAQCGAIARRTCR